MIREGERVMKRRYFLKLSETHIQMEKGIQSQTDKTSQKRSGKGVRTIKKKKINMKVVYRY